MDKNGLTLMLTKDFLPSYISFVNMLNDVQLRLDETKKIHSRND
ncbi:MAG: hypothetical protein ACK5LY_01020 [Lachnospirales bacterium]